MTNILHLSDLHFGFENPKLLPILIDKINQIKPDLIVLSGDLTQRATKSQFLQANRFLKKIPFEVMSVPGNHDIPLYNFVTRVFWPYHNYQKYITSCLNPEYSNSEVKILGLNSASRFHLKNGRIDRKQFGLMENFFSADLENKYCKILVLHHNLIHLNKFHHPIVNYKEVQQILISLKINIVLSGHLHAPYIEILEKKLGNEPHKVFLITAGTSISTRLRQIDNSFNLLKVTPEGFYLEIHHFNGNKFIADTVKEFTF